MADDRPIDRTKVTFSQAEGLEPLPSPLDLGTLSREIRSRLWEVIYYTLESQKSTATYSGSTIRGYWRTILRDKRVFYDHLAVDEFNDSFKHNVDELKSIIFSSPYNEVFDFLTFLLRHGRCPPQFPAIVRSILASGRTAYTVIDDGPTIVPAATVEEGEALHRAFQALEVAGFDGARAHLRKSAEAITSSDFPGSVRESIHAVESVARLLEDDASKTLTPALKALRTKVAIHPALEAGFSKIYGYTNDEEGIRHALLEGTAAVDKEDAVFMLGACASFITYLVGKARRAGLLHS